ncbi:testis-expressed sequence 26 protein [Biomphalaria pfeifferi]|uniref:Testis-expressed sequence 26 protein n=1 Tax=Biomphalaria pfeifferi TaxID=112525 RepID=A0AAD8BA66_BIOPF|nr:testis-expressed sequence 26 protein [Biomphalaria pfeifferi]
MATAMVDTDRSVSTVSSVNQSPKIMSTDVVNTETKLGESVLSPVFLKELESYYTKADVRDKARCLELITSVTLGEELKTQANKRPMTAMPAFNCKSSAIKPYQTSYDRDYPPKLEQSVWALRPMTSQGYATTVPKSQPPGPTTYDVEFCRKYQKPATPERIGTASGNRRNNPHPSQAFMVWRFPRNSQYNPETAEKISEELTNERLNQITKRLCQSVYQSDYLGIPQGFQVKSAFNTAPDWRDSVPYGMESNQRESYQQPFQQRELQVPVTRYGSNAQKNIPAVTVIPTANKHLIGVNGRTTYDRHYNDNAGPVVEQIRDVGKKLGHEALKKYYQTSSGEDKELIGKLMEEFNITPPPARPGSRPLCPSPPARSPSKMLTASPSLCQTALQTPGDTPALNRSALLSKTGNRKSAQTVRLTPTMTHVKETSHSSSPNGHQRHLVPAATPILIPHYPIHYPSMPTSPISVPFSPPMALS